MRAGAWRARGHAAVVVPAGPRWRRGLARQVVLAEPQPQVLEHAAAVLELDDLLPREVELDDAKAPARDNHEVLRVRADVHRRARRVVWSLRLRAPAGPIKPDPGVIVARPAIAPVAIPTKLGFPNFIHSNTIQTKHAVDADIWVTAIAIPALPLAPSALPPLKPNHPTQSIAAPITTKLLL